MTTHEVAQWFDGLRNWLGDSLNKTAVKNLAEISDAFRELPEKPFREFVKDIKYSQGGVAPLVEQINALRNGAGGSADSIITRINSLKPAELKEVAKDFGIPVKRTGAENKALLRHFIENLNGHNGSSSSATSAKVSDVSQEIDDGFKSYCELRSSLSNMTIEELRSRFEPFRRFSAAVLEGIAQRLGYRFSGSKEDVYRQLLQTLEGMNMSQFRAGIIGRI